MLMEQQIYKDFDNNAYNLYLLRQAISKTMNRFLDYLGRFVDGLPKVTDRGDKTWFIEAKRGKDGKELHYIFYQMDYDDEHSIEILPDDTWQASNEILSDFLRIWIFGK